MGRLSDEELEARRREMLADVRRRTDVVLSRMESSAGRRQRDRSAGPRMRTLLLPAFATVLILHFVGRAGEPLGIEAAFTPGEGMSYAGPSVFDGPYAGETVKIAPGDIVGATDGDGSTLSVGRGELRLDAGARATVESLLPARIRLIGGAATAHGTIRIVTPHGILWLEHGECRLRIDAKGLTTELVSGAGQLRNAEGSFDLRRGEPRNTR